MNPNHDSCRINAHYEIEQVHSAKRQIAPLIMAVNALGNLTLNRPDKAIQVRTYYFICIVC